MLDNAFVKVDGDQNGKLDAKEFQSFYEILKPGMASVATILLSMRQSTETGWTSSLSLVNQQCVGRLKRDELDRLAGDANVQW